MVSIVIPSKNGGEYLIKAVNSAVDQKVEKEIIIIDDGSTDGSVDDLQKYLSDWVKQGKISEEGIRVYKNHTCLGVAASRNKGVSLSKGEYIAFLDADDWWHKDKLAIQLKTMKKNGARICCTARAMVRDDGKSTGVVIPVPQRINLGMLEKTNYVNCSSIVLHKSIALEFPMEKSDAHEDYLAWLKILKKYDYILGINKPLMFYRLSRAGKSRNKIKAAIMTYKTYCYAGYGIIKSASMMIAYTLNGIKKYKPLLTGKKGR